GAEGRVADDAKTESSAFRRHPGEDCRGESPWALRRRGTQDFRGEYRLRIARGAHGSPRPHEGYRRRLEADRCRGAVRGVRLVAHRDARAPGALSSEDASAHRWGT